MNFAFLAIQSITGVTCVIVAKKMGLISFRDFDMQDAKTWFPISFALVMVIYTGSKSLVSLCCYKVLVQILMRLFQQYLSIPVYTIFKNLTIILIVCKLALIKAILIHAPHLGIRRSALVWRTSDGANVGVVWVDGLLCYNQHS
jgi:hypothetical protein